MSYTIKYTSIKCFTRLTSLALLLVMANYTGNKVKPDIVGDPIPRLTSPNVTNTEIPEKLTVNIEGKGANSDKVN